MRLPSSQESRMWRVLNAQYTLCIGYWLWLWALCCSGCLLIWCTQSPHSELGQVGVVIDSQTHSLSSLVSSFLHQQE